MAIKSMCKVLLKVTLWFAYLPSCLQDRGNRPWPIWEEGDWPARVLGLPKGSILTDAPPRQLAGAATCCSARGLEGMAGAQSLVIGRQHAPRSLTQNRKAVSPHSWAYGFLNQGGFSCGSPDEQKPTDYVGDPAIRNRRGSAN
jgi:hypothetical protein